MHLREPGDSKSETIASGTRAAAAGGYQAVFDMPNNPGRPTWSDDRLREKQAIAKRSSRLAIGFYAGVDLANPDIDQLPRMINQAAGLKLYMGHTTGNTTEHNLETARPVIDAWVSEARKRQLHAPILLHALGGVGFETAKYIAEQEHFVHWCHVATAEEAEQATWLTRQHGQHFTAGVTPHHLTMTHINADFQQGWRGARMQPPLGREVDHDALLDAYNRGDIQILETDHAPHTAADKSKAERENPEGNTDPDCTTCFGVSGIEFVLPVMTTLVRRKKIEMERLTDSLHAQPKRMLGLSENMLRENTILRWDAHTIGEDDIKGASKNTPYIGWEGSARVARAANLDSPLSQVPIIQAQAKSL